MGGRSPRETTVRFSVRTCVILGAIATTVATGATGGAQAAAVTTHAMHRPYSPPATHLGAGRTTSRCLTLRQPRSSRSSLRSGRTISAANDYVPSNFELRRFRATKDNFRLTPVQQNPWYAALPVGLISGTRPRICSSSGRLTNGVFPRTRCGRLASFEALWHMDWGGDLATVPRAGTRSTPTGPLQQRQGVAVDGNHPESSGSRTGRLNAGTQRLRWLSTAFNLDYAAATIRYYYDGKCKWCGRGYHAGQAVEQRRRLEPTGAVGQRKAQWYISKVKRALATHDWTQPGW